MTDNEKTAFIRDPYNRTALIANTEGGQFLAKIFIESGLAQEPTEQLYLKSDKQKMKKISFLTESGTNVALSILNLLGKAV